MTSSSPPQQAPLPPAAPHHALVRPAAPTDVPAIVALIQELAVFEKLEHLMQATPDTLHQHLFGPRPVVEALVAELDGAVVGYALFFVNFSTFLCKPGLYLEDLYVRPSQRGTGLGERLLKRLAQIAVERDYGRFEWSVLDWNVNAIRFYERMGAEVMPEWRICRVTGERLQQLGAAG
jgi:GNAT superfamily N-acetyltransferase